MMELLHVIVLLFVAINSTASYSYPPLRFRDTSGCQTYSTEVINGQMKYVCKSYNSKIGECPKNTSEYKDTCQSFAEVYCMGDWHCPPGFKCCKDEGVQLFNVCKMAIFQVTNATTNSTSPSGGNGNGQSELPPSN